MTDQAVFYRRAEEWLYRLMELNTPNQPQSCLKGKLAILDLVADYHYAYPDASLREVHDAILSCGSLPPRLMRQQLGVAR
jgi:hypothetical protein